MPTLSVDWSLSETVPCGTQVDFSAMAQAADYYGTALNVEIAVKCGEKYLRVQNGKAALNEKGTYTVVFTAYDSYGLQTVKEYIVKVA